jgi:hypothetical protein
MFRTKRKGIELSMNLIVIAAIVLLVLIILAFLLMGGFNNWNKNTKCETQGGDCLIKCTQDKPVPAPYSCDGKQICCTKAVGFGG